MSVLFFPAQKIQNGWVRFSEETNGRPEVSCLTLRRMMGSGCWFHRETSSLEAELRMIWRTVCGRAEESYSLFQGKLFFPFYLVIIYCFIKQTKPNHRLNAVSETSWSPNVNFGCSNRQTLSLWEKNTSSLFLKTNWTLMSWHRNSRPTGSSDCASNRRRTSTNSSPGSGTVSCMINLNVGNQAFREDVCICIWSVSVTLNTIFLS